MNENIGKQLLNYLLAESIKDSKFNKISVEKNDDSLGISLDGEPFGIVGALTAAIHSLSKTANIPVDIILQMITTYSECLYLEKVSSKEKKPESDISSLLDLFGKYVEEVKENTEGEN